MAGAHAGGGEGEYPAGPRYLGAGLGLLVVVAFVLYVPVGSPPTLLLNDYPYAALASTLVLVPTFALLVTLAVAPGALQAVLARFTKVDLRDGGHVAALVVMTLTLFYAVGMQTVGGVFAVEQVYGAPGEFEPPPTDSAPGAPDAPTLSANLTNASVVVLNWTRPDPGAGEILAYRVYRGLANGTETFLERVENGTNFTDDTVRPGLAYFYAVAALNEAGEGPPSETVSVIVPIPEDLLIVSLLENTIVLVLPVLFYVSFVHGVGPRESMRRLGVRGEGALKAALVGVGVVILVMVLMNVAFYVLQGYQDLPENERAQAIGLGIGLMGAFAIAVGAAVGEEIFFRGFLQPRIGMLGQAVVFAVAHVSYVDALEVTVVFLLAFVFGYLYRRTGNLWAPIAAHFAFNFIQLAYMACTNDPSQCGLPAG